MKVKRSDAFVIQRTVNVFWAKKWVGDDFIPKLIFDSVVSILVFLLAFSDLFSFLSAFSYFCGLLKGNEPYC